MAEQVYPPVPVSHDPESLADAASISSQPTKTRLWPINTSTPMCEEDAIKHDTDFVEGHLTVLSSVNFTALLYISFGAIFGTVRRVEPNATDRHQRYIDAIAMVLLLTASSLSLVTVILVHLVRRFLAYHLVHEGGSWAERSADRQRKLDALGKRRYDLFLKSPTVMLLIASPIFICGVYLWFWYRHAAFPYILVIFSVPIGFIYLLAVAAVVLSW